MTRSIVGLDLSLTSTGIAVLHPGRPPWCGTIETRGKADDTWPVRYQRLTDLARRILPPIPDCALVVMEGPAYSRTTGSQWDRAGLWWLMYDLLAGTTRQVLVVPPNTRAMYGTGRGTAGKDTVLAAAVRRYPDIDITGHDTADAVLLMAIGARMTGAPIDDPMPATHLRALAKLALPKED
ncbi:hypothetical protein [Nocardia puris]|uniref:hypothetical protein n=1 Tax=Nocardia puris TaxID=208602 RepID=UPI002E230B53